MNKRTIFRCGYCLVATLGVTLASGSAPNVGATGASISAVTSSTHAGTKPSVDQTMRALAKLRSYGYTWHTDQGADRAIRAWQRANGLVVDGIVGPQTSTSLGLGNEDAVVAGVLKLVPSPPAAAGVPAVRVNPPQGSVEDIIRAAWPDDLEDRAVAIATRESRLQPGVRNACCYGLFQIHWGAHHSWLAAEMGITSASQLFDAATNAAAAYQLYLRDGGWGPWGG